MRPRPPPQIIVRLVDDAGLKVTSTMAFDSFMTALSDYDAVQAAAAANGDSGKSGSKKRARSPSGSGSRSRSRSGSRAGKEAPGTTPAPGDAADTAAAPVANGGSAVDGGDANGAGADAGAGAAVGSSAGVETAVPARPVTAFFRIMTERASHLKMVFEELVAEVRGNNACGVGGGEPEGKADARSFPTPHVCSCPVLV
jgi:hypothetical protein